MASEFGWKIGQQVDQGPGREWDYAAGKSHTSVACTLGTNPALYRREREQAVCAWCSLVRSASVKLEKSPQIITRQGQTPGVPETKINMQRKAVFLRICLVFEVLERWAFKAFSADRFATVGVLFCCTEI